MYENPLFAKWEGRERGGLVKTWRSNHLLPIVHGMVDGMATAKITITLPDRQLDEIRKRVAAQNSPSVSGFIQQAVQKSLENAAEFRAIVEEALKKTGGPLKPRERAWARKMLSARRRGTKPRKTA